MLDSEEMGLKIELWGCQPSGVEERGNQQGSLRKLTREAGSQSGEHSGHNLLTLLSPEHSDLQPGLSVCFMLCRCPLRIGYAYNQENWDGICIITILIWDDRERSPYAGSMPGWALCTSDRALPLSQERRNRLGFLRLVGYIYLENKCATEFLNNSSDGSRFCRVNAITFSFCHNEHLSTF